MNGMQEQLQVFLTGVMFLTRLPCPAWVNHEPIYLSKSTTYFPVIGVIVACFGYLFYSIGFLFWNSTIAAIFAVSSTIWITGAFHEDGLGDTLDGFGGGWTKDQILTIMTDSRIGTYGSVGLSLFLITKIYVISVIPYDQILFTFVAAHVLARWSSVPLIYFLDYIVEGTEKGKFLRNTFIASVTWVRLLLATLLAIVIVWCCAPHLGWFIKVWTTALCVTILAGRYFRSVIGGFTGDNLGCANVLVELSVYLICIAKV